MTRRLLLLLVGLATAAAGHAPQLPVPPIPPANHPPSGLAPLPDPDIVAPRDGGSTGPQFSVRDFRARNYGAAQGYTPGSQFQTSEDKRSIQTPGVNVRLPLQ
jgi:hypothetical protein